jgi:hypothetical protein
LIYFTILPCQVEKQVYAEYGKYYSENTDTLNALALAAYAKVIKLQLYFGVLHYETSAEVQEWKGQMELTKDEVKQTDEMLSHMFSTTSHERRMEMQEEMLKIQQKRGLASLKYMAWETRVNEEDLLDCWFQMTLDADAYQNMKSIMRKEKEKKRQYDIGPFPKEGVADHFGYADIRYWSLETLGINELEGNYTETMIQERHKLLSSEYDPDKKENKGDLLCKDISKWVDREYQWLKLNLYSTPTPSKNKYFVLFPDW